MHARFAPALLAAAFALAVPFAHAVDQWTGVRAAAPLAADLERAPWIADGRDDAPRKVYVFIDANCKYCTKFWTDTRPWVDSGKVQLRVLLVDVISPTSAGKAATILADADPARRLAAYERAHAFGVARSLAGGPRHSFDDPGLPPMATIPPAIAAQLATNDRLMQALGLTGTPGVAWRGLDGRLVARAGPPPELLPFIFGTP